MRSPLRDCFRVSQWCGILLWRAGVPRLAKGLKFAVCSTAEPQPGLHLQRHSFGGLTTRRRLPTGPQVPRLSIKVRVVLVSSEGRRAIHNSGVAQCFCRFYGRRSSRRQQGAEESDERQDGGSEQIRCRIAGLTPHNKESAMRSARKANRKPQTIPTAMTEALCRSTLKATEEGDAPRAICIPIDWRCCPIR